MSTPASDSGEAITSSTGARVRGWKRRWKAFVIVGAVLALVSSCAVGSQFGAWSTDPVSVTATETYPVFVDAWVTETPDPIMATETAQVTITAEPPTEDAAGLLTTFGAGTWTVGIDVSAGTYRTELEVSDRCYWEINPSAGSDDISQNDIPGGGRPTVNLVDGQQFSSDRCNNWVKQ